uniref:RING-type E3 ubiquitin transferase n=1 Tax=Melopsittacus undulatus TaxID=13146 RepID=A0A8C6IYG7_MELUD
YINLWNIHAFDSPPNTARGVGREEETCCPICLDSLVDVSYVMPCLHQFCYTCILRWVESKPECPLCKWSVIVQLAGGAEEHPASQQFQHPASPRPAGAGPLPLAPVGSFHTYVWASLFRVYPTYGLQDEPFYHLSWVSWVEQWQSFFSPSCSWSSMF